MLENWIDETEQQNKNHNKSQWIEMLGATPVSVLLGGVVMLAIALALWSFNKRAAADAA